MPLLARSLPYPQRNFRLNCAGAGFHSKSLGFCFSCSFELAVPFQPSQQSRRYQTTGETLAISQSQIKRWLASSVIRAESHPRILFVLVQWAYLVSGAQIGARASLQNYLQSQILQASLPREMKSHSRARATIATMAPE